MRRKELCKTIKEQFPHVKSGLIVILGGFEHAHMRFRQDSSFYYLTGIVESGVVLVIDLEGETTLYCPCYAKEARLTWTGSQLNADHTSTYGLDEIKCLGQMLKGYQSCPCGTRQDYELLLELFLKEKEKKGSIFTLCPSNSSVYCWQRLFLEHINSLLPGFDKQLIDISPILESMRRKKDLHEIELLYKAAEITMLAHDAVSQAIASDVKECEVQASLEYIITGSEARIAFPSIVASGKRSTILHYVDNNNIMKEGELVIVDIGADYNYYCADVTRTYPVSGFFSKRQREVYDMIYELQEYIAAITKPGYWIVNEEQQKKSLYHLAKEFLKEHGYAQYMQHGIGHFLGIDVHDVGDYKKPLQEGDVITIEPGIYIPQEKLGIRIEDDYWVVKDGLICLSEALPKKADEIESMVQQQLSDEYSSSDSSCERMEEEIDA